MTFFVCIFFLICDKFEILKCGNIVKVWWELIDLHEFYWKFLSLQWWNFFENLLRFDEVTHMSWVAPFFGTLCICKVHWVVWRCLKMTVRLGWWKWTITLSVRQNISEWVSIIFLHWKKGRKLQSPWWWDVWDIWNVKTTVTESRAEECMLMEQITNGTFEDQVGWCQGKYEKF